jgi:plasmid rolling circle replication initiator protein Rep
MRRDNKHNPFEAKRIARQKYAERQIDKFVKWSWEVRGKVKYKELVELQEQYGIRCYGKTNT